MWFEEHSWASNQKMSTLIEKWRDLWSYKVEYFVAACAYIFATTNFLNLPKLVLDNGGLAFLAAYGTGLLAIVLPVIILELTIGQLTGRAPIQAIYNVCPVFKGVGVSQIIFSLFVMATMTRFVAYLFLYLFHLCWTVIDERPGLPWLHCKNFPELQTRPCREAAIIMNLTSLADSVKLSTMHDESSLSQFMRFLENPSSSLADIGQLQYYMLSAQGAVWIIVFFAICFGVRWLGKVITTTFLFSLILILVICIRGLTLEGAFNMFEVIFSITDWDLLKDYHVWKLAIEQAILATGIGFGAFITIGSYNKRSNNLVSDSFGLLIIHCFFTAIQLATVFSFVGFLSLRTGLEPSELLDRGETQMWHFLTYLSYISHIKIYSAFVLVMAILILLNIFFLLGLNVLASFEDALGVSWSRCFPRFTLAFLVSALGFLFGFYFTTQAGKYAYELSTGYLKYLTLWTILTCELIAVAWFYCAHYLGKDLKTMLKSKCCWCLGHFLLFFTYLITFIPIAIAILNVMAYSYEAYSEPIRKFEYSELIGAAIALIPLLPIPLFALFALCTSCRVTTMSKWQRFKIAFKSPMKYDIIQEDESGILISTNTQQRQITPRYSSAAPGYVLLPQNSAPLAEPETFNEQQLLQQQQQQNRNSVEIKVVEES
jgi:SNF family Na+-dependent transporter